MKRPAANFVSTAWIVFGILFLFFGEKALPIVYKIFPGGLTVQYFNGIQFDAYIQSETERKVEKGYSEGSLWQDVQKESFSAIWKGFVKIPEDDTYHFKILSDDGSRLFINEECIIDHWGEHDFIPKTGRVFLKRGKYPIRIEYFNKGPIGKIRLKWYAKNDQIDSGSVLGTPFLSKW